MSGWGLAFPCQAPAAGENATIRHLKHQITLKRAMCCCWRRLVTAQQSGEFRHGKNLPWRALAATQVHGHPPACSERLLFAAALSGCSLLVAQTRALHSDLQ